MTDGCVKASAVEREKCMNKIEEIEQAVADLPDNDYRVFLTVRARIRAAGSLLSSAPSRAPSFP